MQTLSGKTVTGAVDQQKLELAIRALRSAGTLRIRVFGTSMLPTIWPGDVLVIESVPPDELTPGDIVFVTKGDSVRIHRLVSNVHEHCITRGDAVEQDDPAVNPADVLGKVLEIERGRGVVRPRNRVRRSILSHILCHSQICRRLVLRVHSPSWHNPASNKDLQSAENPRPCTIT
jgi:signal peptidase I